MKEYTVTFTVEITDIIPAEHDYQEKEVMAITPNDIADAIKQNFHCDNAVVSDLKVFITGDSK